jgi:hypothetical protein
MSTRFFSPLLLLLLLPLTFILGNHSFYQQAHTAGFRTPSDEVIPDDLIPTVELIFRTWINGSSINSTEFIDLGGGYKAKGFVECHAPQNSSFNNLLNTNQQSIFNHETSELLTPPSEDIKEIPSLRSQILCVHKEIGLYLDQDIQRQNNILVDLKKKMQELQERDSQIWEDWKQQGSLIPEEEHSEIKERQEELWITNHRSDDEFQRWRMKFAAWKECIAILQEMDALVVSPADRSSPEDKSTLQKDS